MHRCKKNRPDGVGTKKVPKKPMISNIFFHRPDVSMKIVIMYM